MQGIWLFCLLYMISPGITETTVYNYEVYVNNTSVKSNEKEGGQKVFNFRNNTLLERVTVEEGQRMLRKKKRSKLGTSVQFTAGGMLFPQASESRELLSLDGLWSFILDSPIDTSEESKGMGEKWYEKDISKMPAAILMPVPSSYNDITTSASVRDHVGYVWYQRTFFVPASWNTQKQRVWLRFGSVHYYAQVWINGNKVMEHEIGHLPFQGEITNFVKFGLENQVTVSVNNILSQETIPQGNLEDIEIKEGHKEIVQRYIFGFYNYAGIHRPVYLYTTPKVYIDDVFLASEFKGGLVSLRYTLFFKGVFSNSQIEAEIKVFDKNGMLAGSHQPGNYDSLEKVSGTFEIQTPKLWWPYLMSSEPGYLYTIQIKVTSLKTGIKDVYRQLFGFRDLKWDNKSIFINNKPIYIRGLSRHVDSDIRGRGLDLPTSVKDHNLLKWVGANTYRTSHYPFAEETMNLAEQMGFMIIDEVPSVNTENFSQVLLVKHKTALAELINRDKNRACVIIWSLANEPMTEVKESGPYFGSLASFARIQDNSRPITAVLNRWNTVDQAGQWMDVICFNRYNGYFKEPGRWQIIQQAVEKEAIYWNTKYTKPVIMAEYGTETYEGIHGLPEYMWSEEFQTKVFSEHFKAFDNLKKENEWFIGEMFYSFADFKTDQSQKRVGNEQKKGIFTRRRQPKSSAFLIRKRYFKLARKLDGAPLPRDLDLYYVK